MKGARLIWSTLFAEALKNAWYKWVNLCIFDLDHAFHLLINHKYFHWNHYIEQWGLYCLTCMDTYPWFFSHQFYQGEHHLWLPVCFPSWHRPSKLGHNLKGKNLLQEEQILSFESKSLIGRDAYSPESAPIHLKWITTLFRGCRPPECASIFFTLFSLETRFGDTCKQCRPS